jgi:hypothetical protein
MKSHKQAKGQQMATMAEAKRDFENGVIRGFRIVKGMDYAGGKALELLYTANAAKQVDWMLDARTKRTRIFKTYDAAVSAAEMIGFNVDVLGS